jgi:hypothetical protein
MMMKLIETSLPWQLPKLRLLQHLSGHQVSSLMKMF